MNLKSAIESILFVRGEPVAVSRLARLSGAKKSEVASALQELAQEYRERGIVLVESNDEWQLATHPASKAIVEKLVTGELSDELSRAGLEVLAIAAYKGPISRAAIEYIRGVNSSFTLRNLLIRGLVSREENPADRRSYLYCISHDFLKHLGVTGLSELPEYESFRKEAIAVPENREPPSV